MQQQGPCPACNGIGRRHCVFCQGGRKTCSSCGGSGGRMQPQTRYDALQKRQVTTMVRVACMSCGGSGRQVCGTCAGSGWQACNVCGGAGWGGGTALRMPLVKQAALSAKLRIQLQSDKTTLNENAETIHGESPGAGPPAYGAADYGLPERHRSYGRREISWPTGESRRRA